MPHDQAAQLAHAGPRTFRASARSASGSKGLVEELVGARGQALVPVLRLALGGEQHDVGAGQLRVGADGTADVETAAAGHHDVEEHEVRVLGGDRGDRLVPVRGRIELHVLVQELLQGLLDQQPDVLFVVNDQDRSRHAPSLRGLAAHDAGMEPLAQGEPDRKRVRP